MFWRTASKSGALGDRIDHINKLDDQMSGTDENELHAKTAAGVNTGTDTPPTSRPLRASLVLGVPLFGLAAIVVYALQFPFKIFVTVCGVGALTAVAAMFAGGLLGLLFGIPRSVATDEPAGVAINRTDRIPPNAAYVANTNLEQISDWLTKILVGVGLVQLSEIGRGISTLTDLLVPGLGGQSSSRVLAFALLVFFTVWGFIVGYMFARTYLPRLFRTADEEALRVKVQEVHAELVAVQERTELQEERDVRALSLVNRQLAVGAAEGMGIGQDALNEAVTKASRPVLIQIFSQAQTLRTATWRDRKQTMEQTIPVFRALIHADQRKRFHRNYGQLAYALKDQQRPDFVGALAAIEEAIRIRDSLGDRGWILYEMVRAECRIRRDPDFTAGRPSNADARAAILSDLRVAAQIGWIRELVREKEPFHSWREINGVSPNDA